MAGDPALIEFKYVMTSLVSRLRLPEAIGLSLAVISPTVTAAFNITLVVQAAGAGRAAGVCIGMVAMALVALSFMAFTHRVAHAGSAYAYIAHTFGRRDGIHCRMDVAPDLSGLLPPDSPRWWAASQLPRSKDSASMSATGGSSIGAVSMVLAWWLAYRDMRLAGRLMLALEAVAVIAIIWCFASASCIRCILTADASARAFVLRTQFNGWVGLGFGMVFSILSFAGFRGRRDAGRGDHQSTPQYSHCAARHRARLRRVLRVRRLLRGGRLSVRRASRSSPARRRRSTISPLRFASPRLAIVLDLAAAVSCFSGILGGLAAAGAHAVRPGPRRTVADAGRRASGASHARGRGAR